MQNRPEKLSGRYFTVLFIPDTHRNLYCFHNLKKTFRFRTFFFLDHNNFHPFQILALYHSSCHPVNLPLNAIFFRIFTYFCPCNLRKIDGQFPAFSRPVYLVNHSSISIRQNERGSYLIAEHFEYRIHSPLIWQKTRNPVYDFTDKGYIFHLILDDQLHCFIYKI